MVWYFHMSERKPSGTDTSREGGLASVWSALSSGLCRQNPETSSTTRIDILPNPMSEETDGIFRLLGEGVRFEFEPK